MLTVSLINDRSSSSSRSNNTTMNTAATSCLANFTAAFNGCGCGGQPQQVTDRSSG